MLSGLQRIWHRMAAIEASLQELGPPAGPPPAPFAAHLQKAQRVAPPPSSRPVAATSREARFDPLIRAAGLRHGVDPDLLHAVIRAESSYNPSCRSHAGAMGLMQLMPATARSLGLSDPWDPQQNIEGGARELARYLSRYSDLDLALAAYNAGPGAVRRYGGVPPFRETQAYISRVTRYLAERKQVDG